MTDIMRVDSEPVGPRHEADAEKPRPLASDPHTSAEWGIASLALGAVVALLTPGALSLSYSLQSEDWRSIGGALEHVTAYMGCGTIFFVLLLTAVGAILGASGISASLRQRRPVALGLAGFLLNGLNFFMWIGVTIAWLGTAWGRF